MNFFLLRRGYRFSWFFFLSMNISTHFSQRKTDYANRGKPICLRATMYTLKGRMYKLALLFVFKICITL